MVNTVSVQATAVAVMITMSPERLSSVIGKRGPSRIVAMVLQSQSTVKLELRTTFLGHRKSFNRATRDVVLSLKDGRRALRMKA